MSSLWQSLKALPWLVTIGAIVTAVLIAMAGGKIRRLEKRAAKKTEKGVDKMNSGISTYIHQGKKLAESANQDLDKVAEIKEKQAERAKSLGERDESIDDVMHRFNSKRVRK